MYYQPILISGLFNPQTGKELVVELCVPHRAARFALRKVDLRKTTAIQKIREQFPQVVQILSNSNLDFAGDYFQSLLELKASQPEEMVEQMDSFTIAIEEITERFTIKEFQAVVERSKLDNETASMIFSDADSDFWTMQSDLSPLVDGLNRFRLGLLGGQQTNTADAGRDVNLQTAQGAS